MKILSRLGTILILCLLLLSPAMAEDASKAMNVDNGGVAARKPQETSEMVQGSSEQSTTEPESKKWST